MARNTSVTLGEHFDAFVFKKINVGLSKLEEDETKLQVLRDKLQAGENSPLVECFDGKKFISGLYNKHLK